MHTKIGQNRDELMILSFDLMIGKDNVVRLIDLMCKKFISDNSWREEWKGTKSKGCKSYSPTSLLSLLVYGYFNKISSSRRLEKETQRNIEVMWLMEGLQPDHWTISDFRKRNKTLVKDLLKSFRAFLLDQEYASAKRLVFDGTKFKAYANRNMLTKESISKKLENLNKSIAQYLSQLENNDSREDELELALKKIEEQKEKIKNLEKIKSKYEAVDIYLETSGKKRISPNDKDAILVKGKDGKFPGYNGQVGVETKGHFIMHNEIRTEPSDQRELENCVEKAKEEMGEQIEEAIADKGYSSTEQILNVENKDIDCYVPLEKTSREKEEARGHIFTYNKQSDTYTCPQGKELVVFLRNKVVRESRYVVYKCHECAGCPIRKDCTQSKTGRTYMRNFREDEVKEYKEKLETNYAKERLSERKKVVEHPFGTIKWMMGKFNFLLTGKEKVQIEFDLYSTAYNIKRLMNCAEMPVLIKQMSKNNWNMA